MLCYALLSAIAYSQQQQSAEIPTPKVF